MTEAMKAAKTMPKGKSGIPWRFSAAAAAFKAGVQKKTNRYMEPSKKQDARPRVRIRRSVSTILRADFAGIGECEPID